MQAHLEHLFGGDLDGHHEGRVELAWTDAGDKKLKHARSFGTDDLEDLVEEAARVNAVNGQNVYIGASLRHPHTAPFGRGNDEDFLAAPAYWADLDDEEAVRHVSEHYNGAPPTLAVWTGLKPYPRCQLWWRHNEPETDAGALRLQNQALATALGGDPTVVNPSRVMALAGSIKWPLKAGRVIEMVELQQFENRPQYFNGALAKSFPPGVGVIGIVPIHIAGHPTKADLDFGLNTGADPLALLASIKVGNWHAPMRDFVAHGVSTDLPDWAILEIAKPYLDDPADASDVELLIDTARRKWVIPNPGNAPITGHAGVVGITELTGMDLPPRELIFGPWLASQGLVEIYAQRGIGKTFFALNVAYAIATAGEFLGWQAPERRRVLYVDGEMPAVVMQDRARAIVRADAPADLDQYFRLVTPDLQEHPLPDLSTAAGQAFLAPLIEDTEVIILDNLSTLFRSGVENDSESWVPVQAWLLELRRHGKAVIFIHHAAKSGQQRGTSRREDVLDSVLALRRPNDYDPCEGARFEIHFEKARGFAGEDAKSIEAKLIINAFGLAEWEASSLDENQDADIRAMADDGKSQREISKELGLSKTKVQRRLKEIKP